MMGRNPSKWQDPAKPVERELVPRHPVLQHAVYARGLPCYDLETLCGYLSG